MKYFYFIIFPLVLFSCKKSEYKKYKCKKNCEDIGIVVKINDSSNTSNSYRTGIPYKIFFSERNSSWITIFEQKPYLLEQGYTNINGEINTIVNCSSVDLNGIYDISILLEENNRIEFCENPPFFSIYNLPTSKYSEFSINGYCKKAIQINFEKTSIDSFDTNEFTLNSNCYNSDRFNIISSNITVNAILNHKNYCYINKFKRDKSIPDSYLIDSFFINDNTNSITVHY